MLSSLPPAHAAGGFWCDAKDKSLKFSLHAATQRSGGRIFDFKSKLEVFDAAAPKEVRSLEFEKEDLVQHWIHGDETDGVKLNLYREIRSKQFHTEIHLLVDEGHYTLTVHGGTSAEGKKREDPFEAKGPVSCSAE